MSDKKRYGNNNFNLKQRNYEKTIIYDELAAVTCFF